MSGIHLHPVRNYVLLLLFISLSASTVHCSPDNSAIFDNANSEYAKGNYQNAVGLYLKIIEAGYEAPELYYNLGNAYFKTNNIPAAILYFEKAKRLDPSDEDINYNIQVANTKIIDKIDIVPELFYNRWWKSLYNLYSFDGWAVFSIISLIILLILVLFYLFSTDIRIRKIGFTLSILFFFITFSSVVFASKQYNIYRNSNEAIIFSPTVSVKSSPDAGSIDLFVIHEGSKVIITDQIGDWAEIRIANSSKGWVKKDTYRTI